MTISQGFFAVSGADYYRLTASVRGSYLRDQGGSRTGLDQALGEVTGPLTLKLLREASLQFEYRHDFSSRDDAFGDDESRQHTLALSLSYAF